MIIGDGDGDGDKWYCSEAVARMMLTLPSSCIHKAKKLELQHRFNIDHKELGSFASLTT